MFPSCRTNEPLQFQGNHSKRIVDIHVSVPENSFRCPCFVSHQNPYSRPLGKTLPEAGFLTSWICPLRINMALWKQDLTKLMKAQYGWWHADISLLHNIYKTKKNHIYWGDALFWLACRHSCCIIQLSYYLVL